MTRPPRPEHQPIERLAESLGARAEAEGLAQDVRRAARGRLVRWALAWAAALVLAFVLGAAVDWLAWLPVLTVILALLSLGGILAARLRATARLRAARASRKAPPQ